MWGPLQGGCFLGCIVFHFLQAAEDGFSSPVGAKERKAYAVSNRPRHGHRISLYRARQHAFGRIPGKETQTPRAIIGRSRLVTLSHDFTPEGRLERKRKGARGSFSWAQAWLRDGRVLTVSRSPSQESVRRHADELGRAKHGVHVWVFC